MSTGYCIGNSLSERPPIEVHPNGRISARADVRFDEIVSKLDIELEEVPTDTLANLLVTNLERVPRLATLASAPTWSTPGSPWRNRRREASERVTSVTSRPAAG